MVIRCYDSLGKYGKDADNLYWRRVHSAFFQFKSIDIFLHENIFCGTH